MPDGLIYVALFAALRSSLHFLIAHPSTHGSPCGGINNVFRTYSKPPLLPTRATYTRARGRERPRPCRRQRIESPRPDSPVYRHRRCGVSAECCVPGVSGRSICPILCRRVKHPEITHHKSRCVYTGFTCYQNLTTYFCRNLYPHHRPRYPCRRLSLTAPCVERDKTNHIPRCGDGHAILPPPRTE
jgi:hypothetical protein